MTRFILVRHGETEWNRIHRLQGCTSDIPLNETGIRQAEKLAIRLKDEKLQAIYSSPLQRAVYTARAIAGYHQLEVKTLLSLKEINVGNLEGLFSESLPQRFDILFCRDGHRHEMNNPDCESVADVRKRAWDTVCEIASQHPDGTVAIVTHYFVILTLVCQVLDVPLDRITHIRSSPGTLSSFTFDGPDNTRLEIFNEGFYSY